VLRKHIKMNGAEMKYSWQYSWQYSSNNYVPFFDDANYFHAHCKQFQNDQFSKNIFCW
jgi:hypothetical protein